MNDKEVNGMDPNAILDVMKGYFAGKAPQETLDNFGETSPRELLKESLDVVDFLVYLEEESGKEIDIQALGEALLNMNFRELSEEVSRTFATE
jgi:acyl carrier protein